MKGRKLWTVLAAVAAAGCLCGAFALTGCGSNYNKDLCLSLSFDEGEGQYAKDHSGHLKEAKISYVYSDADYIAPRDPEWREHGVSGGCLLFDGYSSGITYSGDDYTVSGDKLTVSAYIAPRMFEWDDPNGKKNGTEQITPIVTQSYHTDTTGEGVMLGYWRFGELSFQFGAGGVWYKLWSGEKRLNKYEWNHVAGVFDGENGTASLYLNGERVAYTEFDKGTRLSKPSDEDLYIGCAGTDRLHRVSGLLDEVRIWKNALPQEYITKTFVKADFPEIEFDDIWVMNILTDDPYKTQFHGGPYQMWTNETHAPVYYNGVYHIFHQFNMAGPFFRQLCWGHFTSTDMVNWTPRKEVITPMPDSVCPDGVWSGAATNDINNVPVLFFTAGNDSFRDDGLISNQNIGYAYPKDLTDPYLTEWVVGDELAIAQKDGQGQPGEFRDPHVWRDDGVWYMTVCSSRNGQGCVLLYESDSVEVDYNAGDVDMNWEYRGVLYQLNSADWNADYGTSWELPVMLPVSNADKSITKHILIISPAPASTADNNIYYFLGTFDKITGRFLPDADYAHAPKRFDYGPNVFTGPSAMLDEKGDMYLFSISQDYRSEGEVMRAGWTCGMSLVRKVTLSDDGRLAQIDAVSALRENYVTTLAEGENLSLEEANQTLSAVKEDMLYLRVTFEGITEQTQSVSVRVKSNGDGGDYTDFTYDCKAKKISSVTTNKGAQDKLGASNDMKDAIFEIENGKLTVEVYVDRSLVETFFDAKLAITMRSYADPSSTAIVLSAEQDEDAAQAVRIADLKVGSVKSIYQ